MRIKNTWREVAKMVAVSCVVFFCGCGENRPLVSFDSDTTSDTGTNDADSTDECSNVQTITPGQYSGTLDGENLIELDINANCWALSNAPTTGPEQVWEVILGPSENMHVLINNFSFNLPECNYVAGYIVTSCTHDDQASCSTDGITCLGNGDACERASWANDEIGMDVTANPSGNTFWFVVDTEEGCVVDYDLELDVY